MKIWRKDVEIRVNPDRHFTCNVKLRRVRVTNFVFEEIIITYSDFVSVALVT